MHIIITLVVIGLVIFFFVRNSRGGAAVSVVRQAQARVRAGADGAETFEELIAEFEGTTAVSPAIREALRAAVEHVPNDGPGGFIAAASAAVARGPAESAIPRKSKKQKKPHHDTTERPAHFGYGTIDALAPLASYDPLPPSPALKKRRPLPIQNPLEPMDVPAVYTARSY